MSIPSFSASSRKRGSRWRARNAACKALARSRGTPGGAANGRAIVSKGVSENAINARASSLGASSRRRNVGQFRVPRQPCELKENVERAVWPEPFGPRGPDRGEVEHAPLELAALDGKQDRWRVGIPEHLLDIKAERIAQDFRHVGVACAFPGASEHQRGAARTPRLDKRRRLGV